VGYSQIGENEENEEEEGRKEGKYMSKAILWAEVKSELVKSLAGFAWHRESCISKNGS